MLHLFAPPLIARKKPPSPMVRRLRRRHDALVGTVSDRLFLAVLPDAETAGRIVQATRHLRISHGLTGKSVRPEHLHVTLCHIETDAGLTPGLVEEVGACAEGIEMPAFRVCFDRAESFKNGALVLRGDDGTIGLDVLQQRLSDALDGEPRKARSFTPHVTLLRDSYRVPEQVIEPIEWTVREVVLMHGLVGRMAHRHLARWTLGNA
jgi:2'-5' RNA ligase